MKTDSHDISNKELLEAINSGFTVMENRFQDLEEKVAQNASKIEDVSRKIDGVNNRLDAEIIRRTDEHAVFHKRLEALEA